MGAVNNHMHSCKCLGKASERAIREFELKHTFYMQETVNWSSKLTFSRERWSRKNARRIGGKHNAVRQADSGFGSRCSRKPRGVSSRPDLAFAFCQAPFLMTFAMAGFPMLAPSRIGLKTDLF